MNADDGALTQERFDLLESLSTQRKFVLQTASGLSDQQARERSTISELTIGGIIKHLTAVEREWCDFIVNGPAPEAEPDEAAMAAWADQFVMAEQQKLAEIVSGYERAAAATDELVRTADLDHSHPLPAAPWFPPGARRSARRVFVHLIGEIAQHSGHADIIREAIDGSKTMG